MLTIFDITAAPVNTVLPGLPGITGMAQVGQVLSATNGTWTNVPASYAYQWNTSAGGAIAGATASTYAPATGDIGHSLTVTVVATNSIGPSSPATSAPTGAVIAAGGNIFLQLLLDMSQAFPLAA